MDEDVSLGTELVNRWERSSGTPSVSVTDLLDARRAFWRARVGPPALSAERQSRIESGRQVHRALESLFARDGRVEVRVRRAGIVGRLDAYTDRPIEFKTTAYAPRPGELLEDRPEHVAQLGMYCALVGSTTGRLITVVLDRAGDTEVRAIDVGFRDLRALAARMERRARELRAAQADGSPAGLPRCHWFDRGCEFRQGALCDCTGTEREDAPFVAADSSELSARPELARSLASELRATLGSLREPFIGRFRELVYPRRAFYDRSHPEPPRAPPAPTPRELPAVYLRLAEAIESGPFGEVARLPSRAGEPDEEAPAFRGVPYLARTSRAPILPRADELVARSPQYALELGFRCAVTGTDSGRVFIVRERSAPAGEPFRVYELRFRPVTTFARIWRNRAAALERALTTNLPGSLPPCPEWRYENCPYRAECGCGSARSQR